MKFLYLLPIISSTEAWWFYPSYKPNPMGSNYRYSTNTNTYMKQRELDSFQNPKISGSYIP